MSFADEGEEAALALLRASFPRATYRETEDQLQRDALAVFRQDWSKLPEVRLHLRGTDFQLKVWETLLKIPERGLSTYADIARKSGFDSAFRAVGTAIGKNPVAFLIPCHRVIRSSGELGHYHWGAGRKHAMIGWEAARQEL